MIKTFECQNFILSYLLEFNVTYIVFKNFKREKIAIAFFNFSIVINYPAKLTINILSYFEFLLMNSTYVILLYENLTIVILIEKKDFYHSLEKPVYYKRTIWHLLYFELF